MNILIACEFSGRVRDAFRAKGHEAWSCDLIPSDKGWKHHIMGDVLHVLQAMTPVCHPIQHIKWDMMIAFPPCTYLCNSGVCWLKDNPERHAKMHFAAMFFRTLLECDIPRIAVENPIPHKYAVEGIGRKYDQLVQPYQFGHPERKATCLWLKNLPKLVSTKDVKAEMESLPKAQSQRIHWMSPSKDRAKMRAVTFQGIADAMAEQWG